MRNNRYFKMNLLRDGLMKIHKSFYELNEKWDGYDAKVLEKYGLSSILNHSFVVDQIKLFRNVGFQENDIELIPCSNGKYQFEAENENICLIIEVDQMYYDSWLEKQKYGR